MTKARRLKQTGGALAGGYAAASCSCQIPRVRPFGRTIFSEENRNEMTLVRQGLCMVNDGNSSRVRVFYTHVRRALSAAVRVPSSR